MSWDSKRDFCGLSVANKILVKSSNDGASSSLLEKPGTDGSIKYVRAYGDKNATPSNEYVLASAVTASEFQVQVGKVNTVTFGEGNSAETRRYALQQVVITTGAGIEPTISANAVRIEDATRTEKPFEAIGISLSTEEISQLPLSCFSGTTSGVELTKTTTTISCDISLHTKNADPVASGNSKGKIEVQLEFGQYGADEPKITVSQGWTVSKAWSCSDPDSDMPSWTISLTKPLARPQQTSS